MAVLFHIHCSISKSVCMQHLPKHILAGDVVIPMAAKRAEGLISKSRDPEQPGPDLTLNLRFVRWLRSKPYVPCTPAPRGVQRTLRLSLVGCICDDGQEQNDF